LNKIKLMYDIAKSMKDKEVFTGTIQINAQKDQNEFFVCKNEFEKDLASGQVKLQIHTVLDMDGKQLKHDSSSEFNFQDGCDGRHRFHHRHFHHQGCQGDSYCCIGWKEKWSGLAYLLKLLDDMEIKEQDNNTLALSLHIDEIPEDLRKHMPYKFHHAGINENNPGYRHHEWMETFKDMEKPELDLKMKINQDRAVENLLITARGKYPDSQGEIYAMSFKVELNLKW